MNSMNPHSALLLFKNSTKNTINKHRGKAVKKSRDDTLEGASQGNSSLISQDTVFSPPDTQHLGCFMIH